MKSKRLRVYSLGTITMLTEIFWVTISTAYSSEITDIGGNNAGLYRVCFILVFRCGRKIAEIDY